LDDSFGAAPAATVTRRDDAAQLGNQLEAFLIAPSAPARSPHQHMTVDKQQLSLC
jgi:hypothetical protein